MQDPAQFSRQYAGMGASRKVSGRFLGLAAMAYALVLIGMLTLNGASIALALPLIVYLVSATAHRPPKIQARLERSISADTVKQNTPIHITVRVINNGPDLDEVMIEEQLPYGLTLVDGKISLLTSLPTGASAEMSYTVKAMRGSFTLQDVLISATDHLGVLRERTVLSNRVRLVFLPEIQRLQKIAIRPRRTHGFAGPIPARQSGAGVEFYGLREYQMGDPRRWINWRSSARQQQQLFVNQFEQERIADVGIILDARQQSNIVLPDGSSLFEYSVQAAGSLSQSILDDGNKVGLLIYGYGMERTFPGYGKVQQERIMYALGKARTGHNFALESLGYLPTRFFPTGSQIVMISPLLSSDLPAFSRLRACGYEVLVVSPDPVSFEAKGLGIEGELPWRVARAERALLLRQIQHLGIRLLDWPVDRPLEPLARVALSRLTPGRRI